MNSARLSIPWTMLAVFAVALMLGLYFTFAAVQGDYGLFRRAEILSDAKKLEAELTVLKNEVDKMSNLTLRMSDEYLDLDLLDEQARDILGQIRSDEVIIQ
ncbi:septum formation initiator family protein [Paracoccaceae bacterium]|jgi:cell division protein FtsB|nr:septum formation initiator family protein [Paracoccaceae bacterium]|tara:strand:+ start:10 stop:312 length:303 start_codon:yes stop_codon:yes gene_type:complete